VAVPDESATVPMTVRGLASAVFAQVVVVPQLLTIAGAVDVPSTPPLVLVTYP